MTKTYIYGVKKNTNYKEIVRRTFLDATNNLFFLSKKETVLIKPAINSPDPYPATTDPVTLKVVCEVLLERGAKVVVGDQSGIGHIMHTPAGVRFGSSRRNFEKAGFTLPQGARFVAFEDEGWDTGFYHFGSPSVKSWDHGFYITNWVKKADHIISLPRLSTHVQTGVTLGFKNWVGILRDDSRVTFHTEGPYATLIPRKVFGILPSKKRRYFEKITEIALAVKAKLRLVLFTATKTQTTFGPDARLKGLLPAYVMEPETGLIIASPDPVAAEAAAYLFLQELIRNTPSFPKIAGKIVYLLNRRTFDPEKLCVWENPFINHARKLELGYIDAFFSFNRVPEHVQKNFKA
jgi:uncharacterized protein (DUF362 family)